MKRQSKVVLAGMGVCTLIATTSLKFHWPFKTSSEARIEEFFSAESREILEHGDRWTLLSIESTGLDEPIYGKGTFHGYRIAGQTDVDAARRDGLVAALYDGIAEKHLFHGACFAPHHGIRARKGNRTLDILICFDCHIFEMYPGSGHGTPPIAESARPAFDAALRQAGVPLSAH